VKGAAVSFGLNDDQRRVQKQDGTVAVTYTPLRMIKCRNQDAE
jgi:hypothetical protein